MTYQQFKNTDEANIPAYEYRLTAYGFVQYNAVKKNIHLSNFMTGGGFFVRRSVLSPTKNLFDPEIDMYCEDTELSLRIQNEGGKIMYSPKSIIYHNQAPRKAGNFSELVKLFKVTRNRFSLYSTIDTPIAFTLKYPLLLIGIIKKINYLGLPSGKYMIAFTASSGIALLFLCLFPYWLFRSFRSKKATLISAIST